MEDMFDPDSPDFLGTGMTMRELLAKHTLESLSASWALQGRAERKRRLGLVRDLILELDRIRSVSRFSTGLGEVAVEDVICGDWKRVAGWAADLEFSDDGDDPVHGPLWARFRELLRSAAAGAPPAPASGTRH